MYIGVSLSSRLRSQEGTAIQMEGVLPYKLEVYCTTYLDKLCGLGILSNAVCELMLVNCHILAVLSSHLPLLFLMGGASGCNLDDLGRLAGGASNPTKESMFGCAALFEWQDSAPHCLPSVLRVTVKFQVLILSDKRHLTERYEALPVY